MKNDFTQTLFVKFQLLIQQWNHDIFWEMNAEIYSTPSSPMIIGLTWFSSQFQNLKPNLSIVQLGRKSSSAEPITITLG